LYYNGSQAGLTLIQFANDNTQIEIFNNTTDPIPINQALSANIPIRSFNSLTNVAPLGACVVKQVLLSPNVRVHVLMGNLV
jgi:hypothetical protein